jgi:hypothetical protein
MRRLILLSILIFPASALAAPADKDVPAEQAPSSVRCANMTPRWTGPAQGKGEVRILGELPPGTLVLAVVRDVGGCIEPAVVRYGYGGTSEQSSRRR